MTSNSDTNEKPMKGLNLENLQQDVQVPVKEDEKTTYEKIEIFFEECQMLNSVNFEYFIHVTELNVVFEFGIIK